MKMFPSDLGRRLGPYEILDAIAAGGMGEVVGRLHKAHG